MPYSTGCNTPLSNFEAGLNYKDVSDPAVMVMFPLLIEEGVAAADGHMNACNEGKIDSNSDDNKEGASLVAWTTTPWTLPSNLALCVNAGFTYVKVRDIDICAMH